MKLVYPKKCELGRLSTPFTPLDRLSKKIGGPRIWIKRDDMTGFSSAGNKVRKLEYLLEDAKAKGCDTLVTQGAFQSNHCRTTALMGNKMGFKTSLLLLGDLDLVSDSKVSDSNLLISRLTGAEITFYDMNTSVGKLDQILEDKINLLKKRGQKPYKIPAGGTSALGLWGYIECAKELKNDFDRNNITPKYIVHATGTSGTQAGLTLGNHIYGLGTDVYGVAVWQDKDHFKELTRKNIQQWQNEFEYDIDVESFSVNTLDQFTGKSYSEPDQDVFETIKIVAELEGILLDPVYSGRGFHGMLKSIKNGTFSDADDIVFLHTGGTLGLFAQRDKIPFDLTKTSIFNH